VKQRDRHDGQLPWKQRQFRAAPRRPSSEADGLSPDQDAEAVTAQGAMIRRSLGPGTLSSIPGLSALAHVNPLSTVPRGSRRLYEADASVNAYILWQTIIEMLRCPVTMLGPAQ